MPSRLSSSRGMSRDRQLRHEREMESHLYELKTTIGGMIRRAIQRMRTRTPCSTRRVSRPRRLIYRIDASSYSQLTIRRAMHYFNQILADRIEWAQNDNTLYLIYGRPS